MPTAFRHRRVAIALAAGATALALGSGAAVAQAPALFAVGGVPALRAGSTALGTLAPSTPLSLQIELAPRDPAALEAFARAVSTPGSAQYHGYLSVAQFAERFGAGPATVGAVAAAMRARGLQVGALSPNGLALHVTATAASASAAFSVNLRRWREPGGRTVFRNSTAPRLPPSLLGAVTAVFGLDNVPAAAPAGLIRARAMRRARPALAPRYRSGPASPCSTVTGFEGGSGPYAVTQVAGAYGAGPLWSASDTGAGVTVALYELEPYSSTDIQQFQSCFGTSAQITNIGVDGGPGSTGSGSGETALDIENVIGIAPAAHIDVYQGPNGSGIVDTLAAIVNQDAAQVISDSWGICEASTSADLLGSEETLLEEAAIQGQTFVVASGDLGSAGCTGSSSAAVDDTASQLWATAVGGTTLSSLSPVTQSAWDLSGGGVSAQWSMPSWQAGPGVIEGGASSAATCGNQGGAYCREVPDVSADADPQHGYLVYWTNSQTHPSQSAWWEFGGTSAAAPVWAGLVALGDASGDGGCASAPLGFLNPSLYAIAAGSSGSSAITDVTGSGNGSFSAGAGYDLVTGLGTPQAGGVHGLVAQLCAAVAGVGATGATTLPAAPEVSGLSVGDAAPGTTETISGSGFAAGAAVTFGGVAASAVTFIDASTLRATVPPGTGVVTVRVATAAGTTVANPADRFTYAPTASVTVPAAGAVYTQSQVVSASYACAASAAGAVGCAAPAAAGAPIDTASLGAHQFTVTATDSQGVQTSATASYTVVAPPAVTIVSPSPGATYAQGKAVASSYSCASAVGVASCGGTVASGAAIDTSTPGAHTLAVTAVDANGISTQASVSYVVVGPSSLAGLRQRAARWIVRRVRGVHLPIGTSFAFTLDQSATVTLRFTRLLAGRLAGSVCHAGRRRGTRCTAHVAAGSLSVTLGAGARTVSFDGATSAGRLAPGKYLVSVTAQNIAGTSRAQTLRFTIAR
jgi:hypothetical protein